VLVAAWVLGDTARRRREQAATDRDRTARSAVADERLRIARDLHDVVAHSMSVIAVQAGTGRMVIDDDAARAKEALAAIEDHSRQALDEMRRLLAVLRDPDAGPAALAPMPHLDDLDALVAHAVGGGTPVDVRVEGRRRPLPAGVELTAFRIVQEALTNVRKHAPGCTARVCLRFEADQLAIEVANDVGSTPPTGPPGFGLAGMRERVALYGGRLDAGRTGNGSFRLAATLPLGGQR
jgi:signal transduction histidine kinase